MDDAGAVRGGDRFGDLDPDGHRLADVEPAALE